jgi:nucleotide-binding universal stress UspA family protein
MIDPESVGMSARDSLERERQRMYAHILLPVDGTGPSERAARRGIELARTLKARVTAVTVTTPWAAQFSRELAAVVPDVIVPESEYERKAHAAAEMALARIGDAATAADVPCKTMHLRHRNPSLAIIGAASAEGCDLIVMGSQASGGITGALLGSETLAVLTHGKTPVLVYRQA